MAESTLPLSGIRIADFTWVGAGPFATKYLGEFGADVIKIESRQRIDDIRTMHPFRDSIPGVNRSGYFANRNPNKRSITLDLRHPGGLDLALRIITRSDVVMNNFGAGVMDRLGLGFEAARSVNPAIIYASMPMVGNTGPESGARGYGFMLTAMSGFMGMSGHADGAPIGTGTNYPDHVPNPLHAAIAVLAAVRHRDRTGQGQEIEVSQLESSINVIGGSVLEASVTGAAPARSGNRDMTMSPHGVYHCEAEDTWLAVSVPNDQAWQALCRVLGAEDLAADADLFTTAGRLRHRTRLDRVLETYTRTWNQWRLADALCAAGVPAAAVADARDVVSHDVQLRHREHYVPLPHAEMGMTLYDASAAKLSKTPGQMRNPAPMLGEHTHEVLVEVLGLSEDELAAFEANGALK